MIAVAADTEPGRRSRWTRSAPSRIAHAADSGLREDAQTAVRADALDKKLQVWAIFGDAQEIKSQLTGVVVSPHRRLAGFPVPAVWPMIDGMQQKSLVRGVRAEIRLVEEGVAYG